MQELRHALVYTRDSFEALAAAVPDLIRVETRAELAAALAARRSKVAFVDSVLLANIEQSADAVIVVAIVDGGLDAVIGALADHPWVPHVVTKAMLSAPTAQRNLELLAQRIEQDREQCVLGPDGRARIALLASSASRANRLERLREFFETQGVPERTIAGLHDIAEELMTNALYDAPVEAGYFREAVPRTAQVDLPPERACEVSYGVEGEAAFVRLRDPFGALTRGRLVSVLRRCCRQGVSLDESRGGAGLGMWRIFSLGSAIAITVIPGRLTDILVWMDINKRRGAKPGPTVQLFFPREQPNVLDDTDALGRFAADHDYDLMDDSFTALIL